MKKIAANIMASTGSALILLAVFSVIFNQKIVYVNTFFEILGANIVVHFGFFLTRKFESRYVIFEYLLDVGFIIAVLVVFEHFFDWFPIWVLIIMAVVIYIFGLLVDAFRTRKEAEEMDELLQKRKKKHTETAS